MSSIDGLLYSIDKRLAVLEALSANHAQNVEQELLNIQIEMRELKKDLVMLRIKVGSIAAGISLATTVGVKWLAPFFS